mmetsp:Transcript_21765/g.62419  ORF Transcript_21765/g.62419 Transcript_21765/m.62419 type:complete len:282 (+) Transcript_21765:78-923(+)
MRAHTWLVHANWALVLTSALSPMPLTDHCASRRSALKEIVGGLSASAVPVAVVNPQPAFADDSVADKLQRIYDSGSSTYDKLYSDSLVSKALDFPSLRASLLSKAYGDVLEIGVGTGLNLPHYPNDGSKMTTYTAIDISPKMMEQAKVKIDAGNVAPSLDKLNKAGKVAFRTGDVNELSDMFDGKNFDCVIDTFSLCVFPQPIKALEQARSVLKPGGRILLLEHQDSLLGKALDPTRGIADVIGTCRYNDDVLGLLKSAGFTRIESIQSYAGGFLLEVVAS